YTMKTHQENIERAFYGYGIFASRHPVIMILFSAAMVLLCCYPLLNLPLPGSEPTKFDTLTKDLKQCYGDGSCGNFLNDGVTIKVPDWLDSTYHAAFVQQFLVKSIVTPWPPQGMYKSDAYRAPLYKVFDILSEIQNFQIHDTNISVPWNCLQVSETVIKAKKRIKSLFPEYGCLLISAASFWSNNVDKFKSDPNIINTINQFDGKPIKTSQSIKELLFGVTAKQSGIKKSSENQVVMFAVTLVLKKYNPSFLCPGKEATVRMLQNHAVCHNITELTTHIHFKPQMQFNDLIPLLSTYFFLGCYIYFSVRKINFVKSKIGMAFSAVVSVMASLMMAVGLCSLIGLTPTLNGGEMFPYLVCIIGLENILVITKSVVATPTHLDVDRRIALGLSREGCSITKNLLLEFVLIGIGYFSFIPEIQEFCAFALVGVLSDFFMHMMFFVTVLSIDIRRLDITEDIYSLTDDDLDQPGYDTYAERLSSERLLNNTEYLKHRASVKQSNGTILKIPKRLKVVFFFADTRMLQRGLMVSMVIWFVLLVYSDPVGIRKKAESHFNYEASVANSFDFMDKTQEKYWVTYFNADKAGFVSTAIDKLQCCILYVHRPTPQWSSEIHFLNLLDINWSVPDLQSYEYLSFRHWPTLFAYYNITLAERFISILPPILIPISITPEEAQEARHPQQHSVATNQEKLPEGSLMDFSDAITSTFSRAIWLDYYLTLLLGAISGMLMVFILHIMYRCVCSRNYANWRKPRRNKQTVSNYVSSVGESMPIVLSGHTQLVECVHTEAAAVISSDISSEIRVWDSHSGDCTCTIQRFVWQKSQERLHSIPNRSRLSNGMFFLNKSKFSTINKHAGGFIYFLLYLLYIVIEINCLKFKQNFYGSITIRTVTFYVKKYILKLSERSSPVWCLTTCGSFVVTGCQDGSIEVWDSMSGALKCHHDTGKPGVVFIESELMRIVAARLNGTLDFFILDGTRSLFNNVFLGTTSRHRNNSAELPMDRNSNLITLQLIYTVKSAHQQPISAFKVALGRVLTGSCDHTLKLFTIQDARFQSTMFGHTGPITVLHVDKVSGAVSGSSDGTVRLWDLLTGLCLHKMEEHSGSITAVQCSTSHVLSVAQDDRLCIWSRRSGMLLQVTKLDPGCSSALSLLGENWCVTGGSGSLLLWDIRNGELLRKVELSYGSIVPPNVTQVYPLTDLCIVCVLGHDLRVVRFPSVLEKID
uniref:Sterol regulatory element-binding protein cleavage-activating protein n=1 Tax=Ciona savignyi TaxID=51511 RepID=H2Z5K7_CIOSA